MVMQAMDTTLDHNSPRPVIYIYVQEDWHQYVGDQIEVIVNRAVTSELADLRMKLEHKGMHHQEVCR
jgi:hypothetical protein